MKIGIIGCGHMGGALAQSFMKNNYSVAVFDRHPDKIQALGLASDLSLEDVCRGSDVILLAVKPQVFSDLASELKQTNLKEKIMLSVMAGVSLQDLKEQLAVSKIIRCMPNLSVKDQQGVLGWTSVGCEASERQELQDLMSSGGLALELKSEEQVDKMTLISGCGPGYLAYWYEAMITQAKNLGFQEAEAQAIVKQTIEGTTKLLENNSPQELQKNVSSKGGVTECLTQSLEQQGFQEIFQKALQEAAEHMKNLNT